MVKVTRRLARLMASLGFDGDDARTLVQVGILGGAVLYAAAVAGYAVRVFLATSGFVGG